MANEELTPPKTKAAASKTQLSSSGDYLWMGVPPDQGVDLTFAGSLPVATCAFDNIRAGHPLRFPKLVLFLYVGFNLANYTFYFAETMSDPELTQATVWEELGASISTELDPDGDVLNNYNVAATSRTVYPRFLKALTTQNIALKDPPFNWEHFTNMSSSNVPDFVGADMLAFVIYDGGLFPGLPYFPIVGPPTPMDDGYYHPQLTEGYFCPTEWATDTVTDHAASLSTDAAAWLAAAAKHRGTRVIMYQDVGEPGDTTALITDSGTDYAYDPGGVTPPVEEAFAIKTAAVATGIDAICTACGFENGGTLDWQSPPAASFFVDIIKDHFGIP